MTPLSDLGGYNGKRRRIKTFSRSAALLLVVRRFKKETSKTTRIINPILPPHSADPWMILHGGYYYYCESRNKRQIFIRRSRTISGIGLDPGVCVWSAPSRGMNCDNVWAPELHLIDGRWFIYYAADDGRNENHRMWALECAGPDPRSRYRCRGPLLTGGWAIDGTVLSLDNARKYFLWSGWPGHANGQQNLYIAPMKDPVTLSGERVLLATPDQPWERVAMPICEGPQVLKRNGDVFVVYSASGSWTSDYCLGLLHNNTRDLLNPRSWTKHGPVFKKTDHVWGVGHCSFVKSLCQTEDWLIYHAKSSRREGWEDRDVHAKRFEWRSDGFPEFGAPLPRMAPSHPVRSRTSKSPLAKPALALADLPLSAPERLPGAALSFNLPASPQP